MDRFLSFGLVGAVLLLGGVGQACAAECDTEATKQQCCSAKSCGGKVLSNRDQHNCKDKSKGKSWHAASDGVTPAQCVDL